MKNRSLQNELMAVLGERYSQSPSVIINYAGGEDVFEPISSQAVVFPENNEEISSILKICNSYKTPVIPFGSGTSLEGNVLGNKNGITISLEKMNKILSVNEEDFDCRVQAYVTRKQLNEDLKSKGVFFPIDPGADASLGGMAATSASGTMAVRYGTMRTVVTGLTVILANGDIIKTGTRSKKSSAGYKDFKSDEWFFKVHWPSDPNVPGMLQIEALVQMCALSILTLPNNKGKIVYLTSANNLKFIKKIVPNTRLYIKTNVKSFKRGMASCEGVGLIENQIACKADFNLILPEEIKKYNLKE